jgi:hypothetical protein
LPAEDLLPWRDVLHEGPVPALLPLDELSLVRAQFIAQRGWGELDEVREQFRQRDCQLAGAQSEDEVVLWFESDLYDQLQLLQVLDWFCDPAHRPPRLSMVFIDRDPDAGAFEALGTVHPQRVRALVTQRTAVTPAQLELGQRAWAAFREGSPRGIDNLRCNDCTALPYLGEALLRLLHELPSAANGLSLTEQWGLEAAAERPRSGAELFRSVQARELRPFMGDASFFHLLRRLTDGPAPLLAAGQAPADGPLAAERAAERAVKRVLGLTPLGREVLGGTADAVLSNGIERWWGGTRLKHGVSVWRWDGAQRCLIQS